VLDQPVALLESEAVHIITCFERSSEMIENAMPQKKTNARWFIAVMMWLAIVINFIDRGNLSVAIPMMAKEFHLSPAIMGVMMSAFFWSYTALQVPAGWFADKVGQRISFALSVTCWSVATAATALTRGAASLLGFRIMLGVGESGAFPSAVGVVAKWFPDRELGRASASFASGAKFGSGLSIPIAAWLITLTGWRNMFLIAGSLGIIWTVVWWVYYREPDLHKYANAAELKYIRDGQVKRQNRDGKKPLKVYQLLKYRNIWAMCLLLFTTNYVSYFFITWFPVYLTQVHKLPLMKMGIVAVLPFLAAFVMELSGGWFSDVLFSRGWSLTKARKCIGFCGALLAASIAIAVFAHTLIWAIVLLTVCKAGHAIAESQVWALPSDVAPTNMASQVASLQNTAGNMAGVVGPIATGFILQVTHSFDAALLVIGGVALLAGLDFLFILGKVEPIRIKESANEISVVVKIKAHTH
jgi:MFS family permease